MILADLKFQIYKVSSSHANLYRIFLDMEDTFSCKCERTIHSQHALQSRNVRPLPLLLQNFSQDRTFEVRVAEQL